jgi:D-mycarose 3-C-methyltransferase
MPLANAFHENKDENLVEYPLKVYFCRSCSSVQLLDIVDPELVFRKYEYLTSASKPLSNHFVEMGKSLADKFITSKKDLVVEIGGNDGVLLDAIKDRCRVLNVDPAWNASWLAMGRNVATMGTFFNSDIASVIEQHYGKAKVIVANNVMAHIENIYDVAKGVGNLLTEDGVFVFEVHWIGNLIGDGGFDQIYHEHLYYHSLTALRNYFGESLFDVELVPIHGQSMRVYTGNRQVCPSVEEFVNKEKELGLDSEHTYTGFYDKIHANKMMLKDILGKFKKVVGYGAPAKGNTLINYYDLHLDYIVDTTPGKQGLFTPGKNIPVYHPEMLLKDPPDAVLVLAWNYADTILKKEQALRDKGVKFIIPVPEVKVL